MAFEYLKKKAKEKYEQFQDSNRRNEEIRKQSREEYYKEKAIQSAMLAKERARSEASKKLMMYKQKARPRDVIKPFLAPLAQGPQNLNLFGQRNVNRKTTRRRSNTRRRSRSSSMRQSSPKKGNGGVDFFSI